MSWVTIIWSMEAAVCLTLAGINLLVWLKARRAWGHLLFSIAAIGAAGVAVTEYLVLRSETIEVYGRMQSYTPIPVSVLLISVVWFTRFQLRSGRLWMAWTVTAMRIVVVMLNFMTTPNIRFKEIYSLRHISFLGETVSTAVGTINPLSIIPQLTGALVLLFMIDVSIDLWRRRAPRINLVLSGSMFVFTLAGTIQSGLVDSGGIQAPYLVSFTFLVVILVMSYVLSLEMLQASQLVLKLKASEFGLRESEERMTIAAETANLGIWMNDLGRDEIWASAQWRDLFGFTPSDRLDFSKVLLRIHPDDRERINQTLTEVVASEGSYDTTYRLMLPDHSIRWIASRGRVESDDSGKPIRILGVSVDITQRQLAEMEVQKQREELAHLSRVSMLGGLSGSLAHELNQPLSAILRNTEAAELFLQEPMPDLDELRAILADIRKDDQRAGAVISRMRSMLKQREVEYGFLDLNGLIGEVISLVRPDADLRKVPLLLETDSSLPSVRGDRVQLQQVVLNLLLNAMDAVADRAPDARRITVRIALQETKMEVAVRDTGTGIPLDKLAHLFEPFFTTKQNGMGLGLPISRTIIEAHGGRIGAENNPDIGATFRFSLPVALQG